MSIQIILICDLAISENCLGEIDDASSKIWMVRDVAKIDGWKKRRKLDVCPECIKHNK